MYKIGEIEMVSCPYNRYHVVSKLRIQKHLVKCQKNYPDVKLATCFYNYSHRVKPEDILKHYEICSHKTRLEGSRYYEPNNLQNPDSLENIDPYTEKLPDINAKPIFFENPVKPSSNSSPGVRIVEEKYNSRSGSDYAQLKVGRNVIKAESSGVESEDDLEPLPLPKTASKAFVCADKFTSQTFPFKRFGRGVNIRAFSPPKESKSNDSFLTGLRTVESDRQKRNEGFFSNNIASTTPSVFEFDYVLKSDTKSVLSSSSISSTLDDGGEPQQLLSGSITSSVFHDSSPLESEEIISDEDTSKDDESDSIILQNFNKSLKI